MKSDDIIKLNYNDIWKNKLFYDVIYNPSKTKFLLEGEKLGNKIENGKMMFIYQAQLAFKIILSNRTNQKAEDLKKIYSDLEIIDWGQITDFDMIINATSLGLKYNDQIQLDLNKVGTKKLFYDVIYNPKKTNFLLKAKQFGNQIENGKMMFIYQAQLAFKIWHNILPEVTDKLLD